MKELLLVLLKSFCSFVKRQQKRFLVFTGISAPYVRKGFLGNLLLGIMWSQFIFLECLSIPVIFVAKYWVPVALWKPMLPWCTIKKIRLHQSNLSITQILVLGPGSTFTSPEELFQFVAKSEKTPGVPDTYCTICQKRFTGRAAVRNHVESIHFPGIFEYPCHICSKILCSKSSLNTHITLGHKKKYWIVY